MKRNKILVLSVLLITSLIGCNNKTSSSDEKEISSTSETSSSSVIKESTITSSTTNGSASSNSSSIISSSINSEAISSTSSIDNNLYDMKDKLSLAIDNIDKINKVKQTYIEGSKEEISSYEYGVDKYGEFVHINEQKDNSNTYYGYNSCQEVYGIKETDGELKTPIGSITKKNLKGSYISLFGYSESDKMYGIGEIMLNILNLINEDKNKDFLDMSTKDDGYKFSFGRVVQDYRTILWMNTLSFEVENDVFKTINLSLVKYTSVVADYENDGVYYLKDNAKPNQTITYSFDLTAGERNATNPYDIEDYYFESFELKDSNNESIDNLITLNADTEKTFYLESIVPSTANSYIDNITIKDESGKVTGTFYNSTLSMTLKCEEEGDYEIVISSKRFSKTYNIHVDKAIPVSLSVLYYVGCHDEYEVGLVYESNREISTYVNSEIYLRPSFSPSKANQEHSIEVLSDNKENISFIETQIEQKTTGKILDVYKVKATEVGIYNLRFVSLTNQEIYLDVTYIVNEIPSFEELLNNRYVRNAKGNIYVDINFTPNEDNAFQGVVNIYDVNGDSSNNCDYSYSLDQTTKKFTLVKLDENHNELSDDVNVCLEFNENYELVYTGTSSQKLSVFSYELMMSRIEWNAMATNGGWVAFKFNEDNTGSFSYHLSNENFEIVESYSCEITYSIEKIEEDIVITLSDESLKEIYKSNYVTKLSTIVGDETYSAFDVSLTIKGSEEVVTLRQGG